MKNNRKALSRRRLLFVCTAAVIAALYVALTYLSMSLGLDKNAIQIRFSEALVALAYLTPAAIPGLTVGCLLANILTGCAALDIALGPIATLIGALGAYLIGKLMRGKASKFICTLPNIAANTVIVTAVCIICYTAPEARSAALIPFYATTVAIGEIISSGVLGTLLLLAVGNSFNKITQ